MVHKTSCIRATPNQSIDAAGRDPEITVWGFDQIRDLISAERSCVTRLVSMRPKRITIVAVQSVVGPDPDEALLILQE
jgi:hypothetical protein